MRSGVVEAYLCLSNAVLNCRRPGEPPEILKETLSSHHSGDVADGKKDLNV
jgi:hypothetical protein